jgi:glycosyltransferase involved in cell wall biosynthesis
MISVLLAAYNGEKYIVEQLESLLAQTITGFHLYIRDDCSIDNTWHILQKYQAMYPEKITIERADTNIGAKYNFMQLMTKIRDDYIFLCDQDDIWLPDKIETAMSKMREMEDEFGRDMPLLVHTDLVVVDDNKNVMYPSFRKVMNANYEGTALRNLLIQNVVTGNTVVYNRALASLVIANPSFMIMHDWWLGLIAAAFGKIGHIHKQTILYRQHTSNEIGAKDVRTFKYKFYKLTHGAEVREALCQTYTQAAAFLQMYSHLLNDRQCTLLTEYIHIPEKNKIMRWVTIIRLGVLKHGVSRKIANFLFV